MSRKIFVEAFFWVVRARFTGDKAVRTLPRPATSAAATQTGAPR